MKSVWLITPAWRRYALSAVCFFEHEWALENMGGIFGGGCVVVTDDFNASLVGCSHVIKRANGNLGGRFNAGIEFAVKCGATHVVPVGSDSFVDLSFLAGDLPDDKVVCSRNYAVIRNDGQERAHLQMNAVTYALPVALLEPLAYRPCDNINRGCDTSMLTNVGAPLEFREVHPLETVSFQTRGNQISDYDSYWEMWGIAKVGGNPFVSLKDQYPSHLVDAVADIYADMEAARQ